MNVLCALVCKVCQREVECTSGSVARHCYQTHSCQGSARTVRVLSWKCPPLGHWVWGLFLGWVVILCTWEHHLRDSSLISVWLEGGLTPAGGYLYLLLIDRKWWPLLHLQKLGLGRDPEVFLILFLLFLVPFWLLAVLTRSAPAAMTADEEKGEDHQQW